MPNQLLQGKKEGCEDCKTKSKEWWRIRFQLCKEEARLAETYEACEKWIQEANMAARHLDAFQRGKPCPITLI